MLTDTLCSAFRPILVILMMHFLFKKQDIIIILKELLLRNAVVDGHIFLLRRTMSAYQFWDSAFSALSFSQEEELRKSGEAKYAHLSNDLHVLIEVFAPPGEAYSRMSHALEEIKKFLVPVS